MPPQRRERHLPLDCEGTRQREHFPKRDPASLQPIRTATCQHSLRVVELASLQATQHPTCRVYETIVTAAARRSRISMLKVATQRRDVQNPVTVARVR